MISHPVAGVSIHVVDVSRGVVAQGMRVEVFAAATQATFASSQAASSQAASSQVASGQVASTTAARKLLCGGLINAKGVLDEAVLMSDAMQAGYYEAVFHAADFYRAAAVALPALPFIDVVSYRFAIADTRQHYHLPMKLTPWGYSCFRGGA